MIEKILDKYYNEKFKDMLKNEIWFNYMLDLKIEENKDGINVLYMKPLKYKNYTKIFQWDKRHSLKHFIDIKEDKKIIFSRIKELDKNNNWK